jgi:hypothetical protein
LFDIGESSLDVGKSFLGIGRPLSKVGECRLDIERSLPDVGRSLGKVGKWLPETRKPVIARFEGILGVAPKDAKAAKGKDFFLRDHAFDKFFSLSSPKGAGRGEEARTGSNSKTLRRF